MVVKSTTASARRRRVQIRRFSGVRGVRASLSLTSTHIALQLRPVPHPAAPHHVLAARHATPRYATAHRAASHPPPEQPPTATPHHAAPHPQPPEQPPTATPHHACRTHCHQSSPPRAPPQCTSCCWGWRRMRGCRKQAAAAPTVARRGLASCRVSLPSQPRSLTQPAARAGWSTARRTSGTSTICCWSGWVGFFFVGLLAQPLVSTPV
jgi:hypothetical protein